MKSKLRKLIRTSIKVIKDCCLENGAIVAANPTKSYYPSTAKNYFYVWPRDASYVCLAADIVGIRNVQENFFNWCLERAEGFKDTGLFFEKYYVNGLKAKKRFQPDQTGTVLFALHHHENQKGDTSKPKPKFKELMSKAANGICGKWNKDHFTVVTNDIWEERLCFPDLNDNFTYSLAACIKGLECANEIIPNKKWLNTAHQMRRTLDKHFDGFFVRSFGKLVDKRIDASVLGLVYPFEIFDANDPKIVSTVNEIEKKLVINGGVHRYEHDDYDGWMYECEHRKKGSGAWPLLNFWLSVYYSIVGKRKKAEEYYFWVLDRVENYIPEQIFDNDIQVSISPLAWSHAMFIIASKFLGFIK